MSNDYGSKIATTCRLDWYPLPPLFPPLSPSLLLLLFLLPRLISPCKYSQFNIPLLPVSPLLILPNVSELRGETRLKGGLHWRNPAETSREKRWTNKMRNYEGKGCAEQQESEKCLVKMYPKLTAPATKYGAGRSSVCFPLSCSSGGNAASSRSFMLGERRDFSYRPSCSYSLCVLEVLFFCCACA